jgi:4-amino-4-deoxy-L-arabinose transferase-like glycosyltransferase
MFIASGGGAAMKEFISGFIAMGFFVAGLFFLRFWRETRDRLFAMFALAFWILSFSRLAMVWMEASDEARTVLYGVRLLAFILLLAAVVDKNRGSKPGH